MSNGPQLVVRVGFKGHLADGVLYLAGTPTYDSTTHQVTAPDLDYTAETKSILLKFADWLGHDALRDALRARVAVDVGPAADKVKALATAFLNQSSDRFELTGQVDRVDLARIQVIPSANVIRVDARVIGRVSATLLPLSATSSAPNP